MPRFANLPSPKEPDELRTLRVEAAAFIERYTALANRADVARVGGLPGLKLGESDSILAAQAQQHARELDECKADCAEHCERQARLATLLEETERERQALHERQEPLAARLSEAERECAGLRERGVQLAAMIADFERTGCEREARLRDAQQCARAFRTRLDVLEEQAASRVSQSQESARRLAQALDELKASRDEREAEREAKRAELEAADTALRTEAAKHATTRASLEQAEAGRLADQARAEACSRRCIEQDLKHEEAKSRAAEAATRLASAALARGLAAGRERAATDVAVLANELRWDDECLAGLQGVVGELRAREAARGQVTAEAETDAARAAGAGPIADAVTSDGSETEVDPADIAAEAPQMEAPQVEPLEAEALDPLGTAAGSAAGSPSVVKAAELDEVTASAAAARTVAADGAEAGAAAVASAPLLPVPVAPAPIAGSSAGSLLRPGRPGQAHAGPPLRPASTLPGIGGRQLPPLVIEPRRSPRGMEAHPDETHCLDTPAGARSLIARSTSLQTNKVVGQGGSPAPTLAPPSASARAVSPVVSPLRPSLAELPSFPRAPTTARAGAPSPDSPPGAAPAPAPVGSAAHIKPRRPVHTPTSTRVDPHGAPPTPAAPLDGPPKPAPEPQAGPKPEPAPHRRRQRTAPHRPAVPTVVSRQLPPSLIDAAAACGLGNPRDLLGLGSALSSSLQAPLHEPRPHPGPQPGPHALEPPTVPPAVRPYMLPSLDTTDTTAIKKRRKRRRDDEAAERLHRRGGALLGPEPESEAAPPAFDLFAD